MKSSPRFIIGAITIVLAVGVVTFLNRIKRGGDLVKAVKRSHQPVQTVVVRPKTLTEAITHTGALAANKDVTLTAEVPGKVIKTHRNLGDRCRRGQVLLQLDPESYRITLMQADAALARSKAQLAQASRDLARTEQLARQATVAGQTLEHARTGVATGTAAMNQAEAAVRMARRNLRKATVRCPFEGVVAARMVEVGQAVSPQVPLARLVDTTTLMLIVKVSAGELTRLKTGQRVILQDPAR